MEKRKVAFIDTWEVVGVLVPKYAKGRTLDVGGGVAKYRKGIEIHVSQYLVSDLYETEHADFVEDVRKMSLPDESFDTVLSFQLLEHVDDTTAAVREMYRVLKKGGHAIATMPFLYPQHGDPSDFHRFTREGARFYFEREGFTVVELGVQGSFLSVVAMMLKHKYLNHYERGHGRIRRAFFMRLFAALQYLDRRGWFYHPDLYTNVYIVARK